MQLLYTSRAGATWDISDLVESADWVGDYRQAARSMSVTLATNARVVTPRGVLDGIENGEMLRMMDGQSELFRGYFFSVDRDVRGDVRTYTAYDGIMHLNRSSLSQNFVGLTARRVTQQICGMFGIPLGDMPPDGGINVSFACIQKTAYAGIMGAWTKVAKTSGAKYLLRIDDGKLRVVQMGAQTSVHVLSPDVNLVDGDVKVSIENAVTRAMIVSDKGEVLDAAEDKEAIKKYGLLQAVEQSAGKNKARKSARSMLKKEETEIKLQRVLGGQDAFSLIAGNAAVVEDPGTGLYGKYYILEDAHHFEAGQHDVSLTLSLEAVMSEEELTEVKEAKKSGKPTTNTPTGDPFAGFAEYGRQK